MTSDDVLAYMASQPKSERASGLQSESLMLSAWLRMRSDRRFYDEIVLRHGLDLCQEIIPGKHDLAIDHAWYLCVEAAFKKQDIHPDER